MSKLYCLNYEFSNVTATPAAYFGYLMPGYNKY